MAYFTEAKLRDFASDSGLEKRSASHIYESKAAARFTIFLSHSHHDQTEAKGLIRHLAALGIDVYVDWSDSSMPRITNRKTAEKIKSKIAESQVFLILATQNALKSRWVPWEIGVADKTKGEAKIIIIPVQDRYGNFEGNEYLQLYRRLVVADSGITAVFAPNQKTGEVVEAYIEGIAR
jgi:hypothetical protein